MIGTWITETSVVYARALWDEGIITTEIARRIADGCTKSAIVGYAHRNGFPPRPSPIIRGGVKPEATPRVPKKPHRKALEPQQKASLARKAPKPAPKPPPVASEARQSAALKVACRPEPLAVPSSPHRSCQWIAPECNSRPWRMCGCPTAADSAYCSAHHARCYSRPPRWSYGAVA